MSGPEHHPETYPDSLLEYIAHQIRDGFLSARAASRVLHVNMDDLAAALDERGLPSFDL